MISVISIIKNKITWESTKLRIRINAFVIRHVKFPPVESVDNTINKILSDSVSVARFGDGEYKVMRGKGNGFQPKSRKLAKRLRQIIKYNNSDEILICVPPVPCGLSLLSSEAESFWNTFLKQFGLSYYLLLNKRMIYYNALSSRLYYDWKDKSVCKNWIEKWKQIWQSKNLLIVEGVKTKLGVGNDLFDGAKSIKRILCPSNNAFEQYDAILMQTIEAAKTIDDVLILVSLGQTATVLAFDLHKNGFQAIDIGHIDIEYEWLLRNATEKIAIPGKYVKEVQSLADVEYTPEDDGYLKEIILRVGC